MKHAGNHQENPGREKGSQHAGAERATDTVLAPEGLDDDHFAPVRANPGGATGS
ncbi:hypothetical protein D3C84_1080790 [compost metagenome]